LLARSSFVSLLEAHVRASQAKATVRAAWRRCLLGLEDDRFVEKEDVFARAMTVS